MLPFSTCVGAARRWLTNQRWPLVDVNSYWVDAYFRETETGRFSSGDRAVVALMSYPGLPIEGRVDSISRGIAKQHKPKFLLAAEGTGDTLALITWVVFGAGVVGQAIESFSWQIVLCAVLSLTLVRMLPVLLVLRGMNLRPDEKPFMGWFRPRGLASIVFAVIVLNADLPAGELIAMTCVCTIFLSVILHGISANPLVKVLETRIQRTAKR